MKRVICCLAVLFFMSAAFSQKVYFVYIESETAQPFFIKMNEQVYSSTNAGYLILSKLKDSTYSFAVGFPQNKWPEQSYKVEIKGKDKGFLLKNFGEKGWGLFDLQTLSVQMGLVAEDKSAKTELKEVSAFTDILSKAANDPSLRENPVKQEPAQPIVAVKKEQEKETVVVPTVLRTETVAKKEEAVKKETTPVVTEEEKDKLAKAAARARADSIAAREALAAKEKMDREAAAATVVKDTPVTKKEELVVHTKTKDTVTESVAKVDPIVKKEIIPPPVVQEKATEKKQEVTAAVAEAYKPSVVRKRSESSTTEGFGLTFVDEYPDGKKDRSVL
jgi:hypothetical protein